jgi:hypothetical protein
VLSNEDAEIVGVGVAAAGLLAVLLVVELLDELPQAATPTLAAIAKAPMKALPFSKCTMTSLLMRKVAAVAQLALGPQRMTR